MFRCRGQTLHIDSLRAPVHVAAEMGQLNVVRAFVHHDVANVLAKDGELFAEPYSCSIQVTFSSKDHSINIAEVDLVVNVWLI